MAKNTKPYRETAEVEKSDDVVVAARPINEPRKIFVTMVEDAPPVAAPALSAKTIAEMEAGRAKLKLHAPAEG